jgi:ankyrin repeat protein
LLINKGDKYGRTALHLAALALRVEMAAVLISKGAVVNAQDDDGETPLHLAENPSITELLLKKGRANPNIPNVDGICALHLAVQRRDVGSVRALLVSGACVNNADNIRWFTPLHLVCLRARNESDEKPEDDVRSRIAQLLSSPYGPEEPDLDYQDSEGNSPLHYAVQLESADACNLVNIFLEKGANPNIVNERDQSPLHLLCHNEELRKLHAFHDTLHAMLFHGADPNHQSMTGCTPLHLSLYHKDIDSALQLVQNGADIHLRWKKPKRWTSFWNDMGSSEVLSIDMVQDESDLRSILAAITKPPSLALPRTWCMQCKSTLGGHARGRHCRHCCRLICRNCSTSCLPATYFPKNFEVKEPSWVCGVCESILTSRKEDASNGTPTTSSYEDPPLSLSYEGDERYSC